MRFVFTLPVTVPPNGTALLFCSPAEQPTEEQNSQPRSRTAYRGAEQNTEERNSLPRSRTDYPGAEQPSEEQNSLPRSRTDCRGAEQSINQSINQYKLYTERNISENIKILLQLYMIMTDL